MKKNLLTFALILLLSASAFAQFSKTHYIPPLSNSDSQEPQGQYMYISSPSLTSVNFKIYELGGQIISGTVSRDTPYVYNCGFGSNTQLMVSRYDVSSVKNNKGYIVEAEDMVYVTVRLTTTPFNYQAGGLVSKGLAALGTQFRIGAFLNTGVSRTNDNYYTFASILATENNTIVSFKDIKNGVSIINNASASNTPSNITLNRGESYVIAVEGPIDANRDGLIGAAISSNKPVAVNCGSIAGSNGTTTNLDLGFDQIVSAERTGTDYIFIKGNGVDVTERPLIIANENSTDVYINGNTTPYQTINAGEYLAFDGTAFSTNGNLYIKTSKKVFAYQGIGGTSDQANQNMHFVPPLSCQTPKIINNIPLINEVGSYSSFTGTVCLVTETGASLDFIINGTNYNIASLPNYVRVNGPFSVTGNNEYVTYTFEGLTGNISVFSSKQVYVSYFGSSGFATYGGFYSGFTYKPEVVFKQVDISKSNCIPNVDLKVNSLSGFDAYQWFFNDNPIVGANANSYAPTQPGYYYVSATLSSCNITLISDKIPVSTCPADLDNDTVNNNIDIDNDNDGIANCTESSGNLPINTSVLNTGTIVLENYTNTFSGVLTTSSTSSTTPFIGSTDGSFISEVPAGKQNFVKYNMSFSKPISIGLDYITTGNSKDYLNSNSEFIVNCAINNTITVLNPDNQLLIDTNYDGYYESGVISYSSFEIRFRLNSTTPLIPGTGTFKFLCYLTDSFSFTHKNLIDTATTTASFKIYASCIPKDHDLDGIADQLDLDSDNDGITDNIEAQGSDITNPSNKDTNLDGIDDIYRTGIFPVDTDNDDIIDLYDLDSDNDGIYDIVEAGNSVLDTDTDGIVNGGNFGANGLADVLETAIDNGILNYSISDSDNDTNYNYIELDSDNDNCYDTIEAGFLDANNDGYLGNAAVTTNTNGLVTNALGYTVPNNNYTIGAPIIINKQPSNVTVCESEKAIFIIETNTINSYQWEVSENNTTWTAITDNAEYSGANTAALTVNNVSKLMQNFKFRVILSKNGNTCNTTSADATFNVLDLPIVTPNSTIVQCDDDTDGISTFNLNEKIAGLSANIANEKITFFETLLAAQNKVIAQQINNPASYVSGSKTIGVRLENDNGCFNSGALQLIVSATQLPVTFKKNFYSCDDFLNAINNDKDGVTTFDFSSVTNDIKNILPVGNYTIKYYKNENDALLEKDANGASLEIQNINNFRNVDSPNQQNIWVRIDSDIDNACYGLGPYVSLNVEKLPTITPFNAENLIRHCDDDNDGNYGFDTSKIESTLLNGQNNVSVSYFDENGSSLSSPLPNPFVVNKTKTITIKVQNNTTKALNEPCFTEQKLTFIVDYLPQANNINTSLISTCDDELNPVYQDGYFGFNTASFNQTILNGQTGMTISYTDGNGKVIGNALPNPFLTKTQNVVVTIENPINTQCKSTLSLPFVVNRLPNIDINDDGSETALVCSNSPSFTVTLNAGITDNTATTAYDYQWFYNNEIITTENKYSIAVNKSGNYAVQVKNNNGCIRTRNISVIASETAVIDDIVINDLSKNNTVEIKASGSGEYIYSLDNETGRYQISNIFNNVSIGSHTVYVMDVKGCGTTKKIISVMGVPPFFSPNNDGYNDTWNIIGTSEKYNYNAKIQIFDRYGKLLKIISPKEDWDGTYNGTLLPATDYWYVIELENGRTAKGHFSLIR